MINRLISPKIIPGDGLYTNEFEEACSSFLDRHEYDEAENYLFSMVRVAFIAGWQAAGGAPPKAERIYELLPGGFSPDKAPAED